MAIERTVVVTGVSSGIGWGTARVLGKAGFKVFGSVRKLADADRLKAELGDRFVPLVFDVTDEAGARAAAAEVKIALNGRKLGGLVNNAGVALGGPLLYMDVGIMRRQLEVNIIGVLITTQAFGPLLGVDEALLGNPGRIVNIGSVGGRHAFPFMAPYHVSKYGLEGFTESLRRELIPFGIDATLVAPGSVATPIWAKADQVDYSVYDNTPYREAMGVMRKQVSALGARGLPPERIGEAVLKQLTSPHPPVYRRVTPAPLQFQALTKLPKRIVDRVAGEQLGLKPKR